MFTTTPASILLALNATGDDTRDANVSVFSKLFDKLTSQGA